MTGFQPRRSGSLCTSPLPFFCSLTSVGPAPLCGDLFSCAHSLSIVMNEAHTVWLCYRNRLTSTHSVLVRFVGMSIRKDQNLDYSALHIGPEVARAREAVWSLLPNICAWDFVTYDSWYALRARAVAAVAYRIHRIQYDTDSSPSFLTSKNIGRMSHRTGGNFMLKCMIIPCVVWE